MPAPALSMAVASRKCFPGRHRFFAPAGSPVDRSSTAALRKRTVLPRNAAAVCTSAGDGTVADEVRGTGPTLGRCSQHRRSERRGETGRPRTRSLREGFGLTSAIRRPLLHKSPRPAVARVLARRTPAPRMSDSVCDAAAAVPPGPRRRWSRRPTAATHDSRPRLPAAGPGAVPDGHGRAKRNAASREFTTVASRPVPRRAGPRRQLGICVGEAEGGGLRPTDSR